jgi:hypothetical protein
LLVVAKLGAAQQSAFPAPRTMSFSHCIACTGPRGFQTYRQRQPDRSCLGQVVRDAENERLKLLTARMRDQVAILNELRVF